MNMEMNTVQSTIRTDAPIDLTKEDADADAQEEERHTTKKEDDDDEERWMWASGARRQQRRRVQQLESDSEDEEPKGNQTAEERKTGIDGGPHQPVSFVIQVKEEEEPTPGNKRHKADEPSLGKKSEEREDDAQRSCKLPKLASSLPTNLKIMIHSAAGRLENAIDPKYASASGASSQVKQREWKGAGEEDNNTATMEMEVQDSASAYSSTNAIGTGISIKRPGAVLPRQKQQCKLTLDQMSAELLEALKRDHQRKRESMAEKEAGTKRREVRVTLKLREGERVRMQSPAEVEQSLLGQLLLSRRLARREAPLPIASDSASGADGKERYCRGRAMPGVEEALCREVNSFLELELLAPRFSCKQSSLIVADTVRAGDELIVLVRLADERGQNITNPLVIQQVAPRVSLWVGNEEQQECTWDTDVFGEFAKSGILCQPYIATRVKAPTWALPAGWKIAVRHRPTSIVKASQDQHTIGSQVVKIGPSTPVFVDSMFDILVNNALQGRGAMIHCGDSVDVQLRLKQRGVQAKDRFGNQATWPPDHSETRDVLQAFSLEINLKAQNTFHPAGEVTSELASETAEGARTWKLCIKRAGAFEVRLRHRGIGVSLSSAPIKCDFALDPSVWSAGDLTAFMCEQGAITKRDVLLMAYNREMAGQDLFTVPRTDFSPPPDSNASDSDITLELFAALTDRDDVVAVAGMSGKAVAKHHAKRVTTLLTERRRKAMQLASPEKMAEEQALREARKWIVGHGPPLEWLGLREAGTEGGRERVELDKNGNLFQHIAAMLHGVMAKCEVTKIEMNCNLRQWTAYSMERERVASDNEGNANERWLWHGSRTKEGLDGILSQGFKTNNVNMDFNYYGAGHYFACDPRFSHMYTAHSGQTDAERQLILCRVACGRVGEKEGLTDNGRPLKMTDARDKEIMRSLLRDKTHRRCPVTNPPTHSIIGADPRKPGMRPRGREVVVFDENRAYPEFIVSYVWRVLLPQYSPQDWQGMLTFEQAQTREPWLQQAEDASGADHGVLPGPASASKD